MFKLWKNMDEDDKSRLVKVTGFVVAVFTVFTLLATVSYFFTWKVDQSAIAAPVSDTSVEIRNLAGKLGFKWSDLLVRKWFGLGSLALFNAQNHSPDCIGSPCFFPSAGFHF